MLIRWDGEETAVALPERAVLSLGVRRDVSAMAPAETKDEGAVEGTTNRVSLLLDSNGGKSGEPYHVSKVDSTQGGMFYADSRGNINLAKLPDEVWAAIGRKRLPFRMNTSMAQHIFERHGEELGLDSPVDAVGFVVSIMENVDHVRDNGNGSFIFSVEDSRVRLGKRAIAIVVNVENGDFLGVKTAGYDRLKNLEKNPLLWARREKDSASGDAASPNVTSVTTSESGSSSGDTSFLSRDSLFGDKDNKGVRDKQEDNEMGDVDGGAAVEFSLVPEGTALHGRLKKELTTEGEYVTLYRAARKIDGRYYSPKMTRLAGVGNEIVLGKIEMADERPDLARWDEKKGRWLIDLDGGGREMNGGRKSRDTRGVLYNPHIHCSDTPLNDQFTAAWDMPDMVVLEVRVPKSEVMAAEPYRAERAALSVGRHKWPGGHIDNQMPSGMRREVYLTRYDMPVREVPVEEVADMIAERLRSAEEAKGEKIRAAWNVFTPALQRALEERGVELDGAPAGNAPVRGGVAASEDAARETVEYSVDLHRGETAMEIVKRIMSTPIIKVTAEDMNALPEGRAVLQSFKDKAKGWRKSLVDFVLRITPRVVSTSYGEVEVHRHNIRDIIAHRGGDLKVLSLMHIKTFLQNGVLYDVHMEDDGFTYYNYAHRLTYKGKDYIMRGTVREDRNGKRIYDHEFTEMEEIEKLGNPSSADYAADSTSQSLSQAKILKNIFIRAMESSGEAVEYSVREEDRELIAVHNLDEKKLRDALTLGGFPMPSIAITKGEMGHTDFGDISLVFGRETIDPADGRNRVYTSDAWTPMFPKVGLKVDPKVTSRVRERVRKALGEELWAALNCASDMDGRVMDERINAYGGYGVYAHYVALALAYLREKGVDVEVPMVAVDYGEMSPEVIRLAGDMGLKVVDILNEGTGAFMEAHPEFEAALREGRLARQMAKVVALASPEKAGKITERMRARAQERMSFMEFDGMMHDAWRMERDLAEGGLKEEVDEAALRKAVWEKVDSKDRGFGEWLDEVFAGVVEKRGLRNDKDAFTASGNRRSWESLHDDFTLDNVVKAMLKSNARGGEGFFGRSFTGAAAGEYGSVEDIRAAAKERLKALDPGFYKERSETMKERFEGIVEDVTGRDERMTFERRVDAYADFVDAVGRHHDARGLYKALHKDYPTMTMDDARKLEAAVKEVQAAATRFFEAKPGRAVGLDEVKLAVVPEGTDVGLVDALRGRGIEVLKYERGDEAARVALVDAATREHGIRFMLREDGRSSASAEDVSAEAGAEPDSSPRGVESAGEGVFGKIFNQFRGKVKDAVDFLLHYRQGDLTGVFSREGFGEVDFVWGDKGGGFAHIIDKHVGKGKSFATPEDAAEAIDNIIKTGVLFFENGDRAVFRIGSSLVTVRKNFRSHGKKIAVKNWVLTAYDEAAGGDISAIAAVNQAQAARGTAKSEGKDSGKVSDVQEAEEYSLTPRAGETLVERARRMDEYHRRHRAAWRNAETVAEREATLTERLGAASQKMDEALHGEAVGSYILILPMAMAKQLSLKTLALFGNA